MKPMPAACAVAVGLAALSACNRSAEATSTAGAIDLPTIAAGKWHWREQIDGRGGDIPGEQCFPERTLWDVLDVGVAGLKSCQRSIVEQGAGYAAQYQCESDRSAITITATVSGDFKTNYRMESVQKFDPPLGSTAQQIIARQAERRGDC